MNLIEKRVEETMQSLDNIHRAEMDGNLHQRIMNRLRRGSGRIISIAPQTVWRAAAAIVLLIAMNVFSILHFSKAHGEGGAKMESNAFAQEYFSYSKPVQF